MGDLQWVVARDSWEIGLSHGDKIILVTKLSVSIMQWLIVNIFLLMNILQVG